MELERERELRLLGTGLQVSYQDAAFFPDPSGTPSCFRSGASGHLPTDYVPFPVGLHQRANGREGWRRLDVKISRWLNPGCHSPSHVSLCPSSIHLGGFRNSVVETDDNARCYETLHILAPFYEPKWGNFPWKSWFKVCGLCVGETNNDHIIKGRIPCSFLTMRSGSGSDKGYTQVILPSNRFNDSARFFIQMGYFFTVAL